MSDDRELSDLYQSADKPQPSAALDAVVKAAARQPLKSRRSYALQWIGGVAATVFAALIVVQMLPIVEQQAGYDSMMNDAPAETPARAEEVQINKPARRESPAAVQSLAPRKKLESKQLHIQPKSLAAEDDLSRQTAENGMQKQRAASPATAESEMQAISTLLDDGKTGEAVSRLRNFRQRYPDFKIPEALLKRLEEPGISH